jgi:hypothetical protein
MKYRVWGGFPALSEHWSDNAGCLNKTQAGSPEFLPVPACASINLEPTQFVGLGLTLAVVAAVVGAAAVLAAGAFAGLYRESRG